jgi:hypothetical protein
MQLLTKESPHPSVLAIGALAFVLELMAPIAVDAEIIPVQSEASSIAVAAPPPPTVLRGSSPSIAKSVPRGWGSGDGGFSGFHRSHRFAGFHGFRHFGVRAGHMGGFGQR